MVYQAKPGDHVRVNHENMQLDAIVHTVQASGKVDCTINQRGKFFGRLITFGSGDVRPLNDAGDGNADEQDRLSREPSPHGSESYAEMARRVEDERRWKNTESQTEFDRRLSALEARCARLESEVGIENEESQPGIPRAT